MSAILKVAQGGTGPDNIGDVVRHAWRCASCTVRLAARAVPAPPACPLCGASLVADGVAPTPSAAVVRVRHDRDAFGRAVLDWLAACDDIADDVVARFALPRDLAPLYLPFRRVHGTCQARRPAAGATDRRQALRGPYAVDVCVAAGLDEAVVEALEAAVEGQSSTAFGGEPMAGAILLGEVDDDRASDRLDRLLARQFGGAALGGLPQTRGEQYFLVPVWLYATVVEGRTAYLLMEAGSGRLVSHLPAGSAAEGLLRRLAVLGHWAWVPALFCALLVWLMGNPLLRVALVAVAVATLVGGYAIAGKLVRAALDAQRRLVAEGTVAGPACAAAWRDLGRVRRVAGWLPGAYAGIIVGTHLALTSFCVAHAPALSAGARHVTPGAGAVAATGGSRPGAGPGDATAATPAARGASASGRFHGVPGRRIELGAPIARQLFVDSVRWLGHPGGDAALRRDLQPAAPGHPADDPGVATDEPEQVADGEAPPFRAERGEVQLLDP